MKHVIAPLNFQGHEANKPVEESGVSLGGCFYDYLRRDDGQVIGVRYWLLEPVNFEQHQVYSQFRSDERFLFDAAGGFVDVVFSRSSAEFLKNDEVTVDVVQEFGGESVLKCGNEFAIVFSLVE